MKHIAVLLGVVLLCTALGTGPVYGQPMGPGIMGHGGEKGGPHGHGMAAEKMRHKAGMAGIHGHGMGGMFWLMHPFHRWIGNLMANQRDIGLSPKQVGQLESAITGHLKIAVRNRAEVQVLKVDLGQALRQRNIDPGAVKELLKKQAAQDVDLQMQGIELYLQVLHILTEQQKEKVMNLIGPPFPFPWESMSGGFHMRGGRE